MSNDTNFWGEKKADNKDIKPTEIHSFDSFELRQELRRSLFAEGFYEPTPIQEKSLAHSLKGENVIGRAKNGTGKTGAYLIPLLNKIDTSKNYVQALVLTTSRELSLQVVDECKKLGKFMNVEVMSCIGGEAVKNDLMRLSQTVHVISATSGRINHLLNSKYLDLSHVSVVVLDEVDVLLSEDNVQQINQIFNYLPATAQRLVFSATFPEEIESSLPVFVNAMNELTLEGVTQFYCIVEERQKMGCLRFLIRNLDINQMIIFCNTVDRVEKLYNELIKQKLPCLYIHSKMNQQSRNQVLYDFKNGSTKFLVASDLFSRGIDNQRVNVVVNFDIPRSSDTYLNRVGRSGRYGSLGISVSMITDRNIKEVQTFEKELDIRLEKLPKVIKKELYAM